MIYRWLWMSQMWTGTTTVLIARPISWYTSLIADYFTNARIRTAASCCAFISPSSQSRFPSHTYRVIIQCDEWNLNHREPQYMISTKWIIKYYLFIHPNRSPTQQMTISIMSLHIFNLLISFLFIEIIETYCVSRINEY